jgi:hypothetical protein
MCELLDLRESMHFAKILVNEVADETTARLDTAYLPSSTWDGYCRAKVATKAS